MSVEIFQAPIVRCPVCEGEVPGPREQGDTCCHGIPTKNAEWAWWWWYCEPGCLPDSDAFGPFETEEDAREDLEAC